MSYYSKSNDSSWIASIAGIILGLAILLGVNACTAQEWNDGVCAKCHEQYVLRGVYDGIRYYSCPDCGNEVSRFGGR